MYFDLELEKLKQIVEKKLEKGKTIFIQLPEGLKTKIKQIKTVLKNYNLVFSIDPVFGACDLQEHYAKIVNADLTIHFGHVEFYNAKKIIYWPGKYVFEEKEIKDLKKKLEAFKNKKITFIFPIQYSEVVEKLKTKNYVEPKTNFRIKVPGQVLGCDVSTVLPIIRDIDYIFYIGDGNFHNTAFINFPINKKIFWLYPFEELKEIKIDNSELKRRNVLKYFIKDKQRFGIYISSKKGQNQTKIAFKLKTLLENHGKEVILLVGDNLSNEKLIGLNIDVLVNTACPRIMDDFKNYDVVIINANYVFEVFERRGREDDLR